MKKVIHVNQHVIRSNIKNSANEPVLTVKTYKSNEYAHEVELLGDDGEVLGRFVYNGDSLSCGARVWFETNLEVRTHCRT